MSSVVPEGWFSKSLDEVSIFIRDGTHGTHERLNEGIPLLSAKNISSDGHINCDSTDSLICEVDYQKIHAKYAIEKDDLLLTVVGTLGRTALVPKGFRKFTLQRSVAIIRLDSKTIHPELCYQYLSGDEFQRQLSLRSNSTAQAGVYLGELGKISIPIPPLPEQKKIASILTSVDEVIENTQKQIDKLQDLKNATMNELLTKGIGHTEFKDSELGRIPKSWEVVELNDLVGSLSGGVSVNSENRNRVGSELGVLKTSCISNGKFLSNEHKAVLSEDVHRVRTPVEAEIILFSRMNTPNLVGESGYVEQSFDNLYLPDRLWALKLRDKSKTSVRWLSWLLVSRSVKSDISNAATGTSGSMKNISKPNLLAIKVRHPPVNEQFQIASVINSLEYKRVSTQTKMNTLVSLKKSLMQDLLTGKVRVTVN